MKDNPEFSTRSVETRFFQLRVKGLLDLSWSEWFKGWTIYHEKDEITVLYGLIQDQAELFRVINRLQDLGLNLLSLVGTQSEEKKENSPGFPEKEM